MPNSNDLKDLESQLKKTLISAESFKRGSLFDSFKSIANIHKTVSSLAGHVRKVVIRVGDLEKRVENNSRKITSLKNISALQGPQIRGTNIGAKLPGGSVQTVDKNIAAITESVSSIAEILAGRKKLADDTAAFDRKKSEQEKRALAESKLEKRFDGLKRAAEKILSPVKSILDKIINFLVTVLLGRVVYKLIEWWGDPKNAGKVKSIIRFLTDWGPALLGGFILFGTRFGKGVRILTRIALSGIAKLAKAIPSLLRFARGNPRTALALAAGTYATTQLAGRAFSSGDEKPQGLVGGGYVIPRFSGGGLNFGNLFSGLVSGKKGTDKIPAMLSDGEFVMSAGAVQKYGVDTLEAMNAAGGGTNKPKMMSGTVYAQGGGLIGSERYDLTTGFRGETSKSDIYLVRAINELIKVLRNKFPAEGGGGSYPSQSGPSGGGGGLGQQLGNIASQIVSRSAKAYQGASTAARGAAKKAEPMMKSLPARIDYGSLYLRSQLGGLGGSITEADLSKQTQDEYARAFAVAKAKVAERRAGVESQVRYYEGLLKAPNLTAEQKTEFQKQLRVNQSRLDKYKKGQIDVQYEDFADKNGRVSPAASAAQKTLGAVWATATKDGGIQIEKEPYDFPIVNDPLGLMFWPSMSKKQREEWLKKQPKNSPHRRQLEQNPNAWGKQKIAEAMYSLNPFATSVETDVKIGGTPRAKGIIDTFTNFLDNPLLSMTRGLGMNLLKGKERNVITGEAESGSLFDRMFPRKKESLPKPGQSSGAASMYAKPQANTGQAYQSRFARPRNAGIKPVKQPVKPKVTVVRTKADTIGGGGQGGGRSSRPKTPSFSATTRGSSAKANTLGIPNQASYR